MSYFKYCVPCSRMFIDEPAYVEHMRKIHGRNKDGVRIASEKQNESIAKEIQKDKEKFAADTEAQSKFIQEVNEKRKRLIHAGIDAATMKPDEVNSRYDAEKKAGKVR